MVMDTIKHLSNENPARKDFRLYVVSLDDDEENGLKLVQKFFTDHEFIVKTT